ncbi:DUF4174 domain-containing protein [Dyadobacter sandarakinus]|uniref:DUF4174 domain-containing protein n=1 Tax=Dyadobacter sandarakinus TaxID=2747268 RepID=A0ABX7I187_9BACT|nr:DUF4174 domain-containing protein [Dyadobacter sandarakinus]QRQ99835.1 DUF4174 domain-containing protein [Dyadobacter sandarakinus]
MKTLITWIMMMGTIADQPRQVLLFYNANGEQQWKSQLKVLEASKSGIDERDIKVVSISSAAQQEDQWKQWKVDRNQAFTFILVGRDGGEKLRSNDVVATRKLFGLVDAMPMRKSEMKDKDK